MNTKLDVLAAVGDAFSSLTRNFGAALTLALPWMLLVGGLTYLSFTSLASLFTPQPGTSPAPSFAPQALQFLVNFVTFVAGAVVAVAWHRRLLIGEQTSIALPSGYMLRYIGVMILIFLALFGPLLIAVFLMSGLVALVGAGGGAGVAVLGVLLIFVPMIAAAVVALRMSLVLPARAIGDTTLRLRDSWTLTKGNTWRLILGTLLSAVIPALIINFAMLPLMFGSMPTIETGNLGALEAWMQSLALPSALISMAYMLISMIGIGFLSFAYRHFRSSQAPTV